MGSIVTEVKKSLYLPFFLLSCLGVTFVCSLSEGYLSFSGKNYTILELFLFLRREAMLVDISMNRYEIWTRGIGTWTQLLLPFLLSIGYLYTASSEKLYRFDQMMLSRENNLKYAVSKIVAATLSGGLILLAGYVLFGILVYAKFPSVYEYPEGSSDYFKELYPGFQETFFCLKQCIGIFFYGMCSNVFAYLVSIFFRDKYILLCLPIMLKYIYVQIIMKIERDAINNEKEGVINLCSDIKMENILHINLSDSWGITVLFVFGVYLIGFCLALYLLKKRGEGFGFE